MLKNWFLKSLDEKAPIKDPVLGNIQILPFLSLEGKKQK